jgi:hypothetical protein
MRPSPVHLVLVAGFLALAGCSASPAPESAQPPPSAGPSQPSQVVSGAPDTMGSIPGSTNSPYVFRFKQIEPSSAQFNFRDRDLSFYFRPSPTALYFRVENLQGRPVTIQWDDCRFYDVNGRSGKVAHSTTRWKDRYSPLVLTQVPGQQQYGDYTFPIEYLLDPGTAGGGEEQPHLPLIPEDSSAPTYSGRTFGVDLAFMVEDRPRTYSFRFQIESVIPR